jgi:hypothetical protein
VADSTPSSVDADGGVFIAHEKNGWNEGLVLDDSILAAVAAMFR